MPIFPILFIFPFFLIVFLISVFCFRIAHLFAFFKQTENVIQMRGYVIANAEARSYNGIMKQTAFARLRRASPSACGGSGSAVCGK